MEKIVERELSYIVCGVLFDVASELGGGYQEKYYQRAIAKGFKDKGLKFKEQLAIPLEFRGESIGRYFIDFVIEGRVVLEIKASNMFYTRDVKQVLAYLQSANINLGILANFTRSGLKLKRVLKGFKHSR
ncbi:MAG TPA: GxxExxY protein [Candidatus Paceibacterota bacterium]|nr:GxxExxY protein [Candidatus Paceibacterota bacterium]